MSHCIAESSNTTNSVSKTIAPTFIGTATFPIETTLVLAKPITGCEQGPTLRLRVSAIDEIIKSTLAQVSNSAAVDSFPIVRRKQEKTPTYQETC